MYLSLCGGRVCKCPLPEENTKLLLAYSSFSAEMPEEFGKLNFRNFAKFATTPLTVRKRSGIISLALNGQLLKRIRCGSIASNPMYLNN
jgi:hypothetical protein